jgi:glycosyltransferase involved in cell wall biosynthesis
LEIPTYPYDGEFTTVKQRIYLLKESFFRRYLRRYVDMIVTYSLEKDIFKIPTAHISNAVSSIPPLLEKSPIKDRIELISVANMAFWHGFDRMISGLHNYYNNNPKIIVNYTLVGDGDIQIINSLKEQTHQLGLDNYIHFVGGKSGSDLDEQFVGKHLAIGCLGCHRKGIKQLKALKNVEYAMRGIPFVYSEDNIDFDDKCYVLKVPADESPIDIQSLCDFVKQQKWSPVEIRDSVGYMTWDNQMLAILDKFNSNH